MKNIVRIYVLFFIILFSGISLYSETNTNAGTTSVSWIKIGVGARPAGMGETYTAIGDDAISLFWNPACLSRNMHKGFVAMYGKWFADIGYHAVALVIPTFDEFGIPRRAIGIGATSLQVGEIPITTDTWLPGTDPNGTFTPGGNSIIFSFSQGLGDAIAVGINAKLISEKIYEKIETAYTADIGVLMRAGDENSRFGIGVVGQNLIGTMYGNSLPQNIKAGIGLNMGPLTFGVDINMPNDHGMKTSLGGEFLLGPIALRAGLIIGLNEDELGTSDVLGIPAGLSIGVGLNTRLLGLDFAAVPLGSLGDTIRVSMNLKF